MLKNIFSACFEYKKALSLHRNKMKPQARGTQNLNTESDTSSMSSETYQMSEFGCSGISKVERLLIKNSQNSTQWY